MNTASYVLDVLMLVSLWLAGSKKLEGWIIGLSVQVAWTIWGLSAQHPEAAALSGILAIVYLRNWLAWWQADERLARRIDAASAPSNARSLVERFK